MRKKPRRSFMGNYHIGLIHVLRFFHNLSYKLWGSVGVVALLVNEAQQYIATGQISNPKDLFVVRLILDHLFISIPTIIAIAALWWIGWEAEKEWQMRKEKGDWTEKQKKEYIADVVKKYGEIRLVVDFLLQDTTVAKKTGLKWEDIMQPLAFRRDSHKIHQLASGDPDNQQQQDQEVASSHSALQVLERSRTDLKKDNVVALGDPGSGKTIMAYGSMFISGNLKTNNPDATLPVYISLPEMAKALSDPDSAGADGVKALKTVLEQQELVLKKYPGLLKHVIEEITNGAALLYLDSLDEVDGEYRDNVLDWINAMAQKVSERQDTLKGGVVVTTRFTDYRGGDLKTDWFSEWVLQGLEPDKQTMLAEKLLPELQKALVDKDNRDLSEQEKDAITAREIDPQRFLQSIDAATWKTNPMLFSMAAYVYVCYGGFPRARVILYNRLIEGMILRRSPDKSPSAILTKKLIIAELAYTLFDRAGSQSDNIDHQENKGGKVYTEEQLSKILAQIKLGNQTIEEMMEIIKESGIMTPMTDRRFIFRHQSFQDYLAGVWIAAQLENINESISAPMLEKMKSASMEERWSEPLRYMVGELFSSDDGYSLEAGVNWLKSVAEHYQEDQSLVLLFLLEGSIAEIPELENKVKRLSQTNAPLDLQAYIQLWIDAIDKVTEGTDEDLLLRTTAIIAGFPDSAQMMALPQLIAFTQQDTPERRQTLAAKALGEMQAPDAREALQELLYRATASEQGRRAAAQGLTRAGTEGCEILAQGLRSDDNRLKRIIAGSLGAVNDPDGVNLLDVALQQDDAETRKNAIFSLKELGSHATPELLKTALQDKEQANRAEAIAVVALAAQNYGADTLQIMIQLLPSDDERTQAVAQIVSEVRKAKQPEKGIELANRVFPSLAKTPAAVLVEVARAQKDAGVAEEEIRAALEQLRQSGDDRQYAQLRNELIPDVPDRLRLLGYTSVIGQYNGKETKAIVGPLCAIPAGEFLMGSDKNKDRQASDDELPQFPFTLEEYAIGKYPLTVAEYQAFVEGTGRKEPDNWRRQLSHLDHPVVDVSWEDVQAYAQWLAQVTGQPYRLPSEAEWEKAARGTDGRIYPWGNKWDASKANTSEKGPRTTTPVGSYPQGASPYGVMDMAGNVWEWTSTIYVEKYPYRNDRQHEDLNSTNDRVLRGGSWNCNSRDARAAYRFSIRQDDSDDAGGARLAVSRFVAGSKRT